MSDRMDWEKARARDRARPERTEVPVIAWWWAFALYPTRCFECREAIPQDAIYAYNHPARSAMCQVCADNSGERIGTSKRVEAARQNKQPVEHVQAKKRRNIQRKRGRA